MVHVIVISGDFPIGFNRESRETTTRTRSVVPATEELNAETRIEDAEQSIQFRRYMAYKPRRLALEKEESVHLFKLHP